MKNSIVTVMLSLFLLNVVVSISGCGYKAPPFYSEDKAE